MVDLAPILRCSVNCTWHIILHPQGRVFLTSLYSQGGLERDHSTHAIWRGMEGASTNVHKVFPSRKHWLVQVYPNGVCPKAVTSITKGPRKLFVYHTTVGPSASYRLQPALNCCSWSLEIVHASYMVPKLWHRTVDPSPLLSDIARNDHIPWHAQWAIGLK